jgi:hypothetical protein
MRVAITTTARNLDDSFADWCAHHLTLVDCIYLWLDDPAECHSPHIPCDVRIQARPGSQSMHGTVHGNMMYRQIENANHAMAHCLSQAVDWLIHIDSDELIYAANRETLYRSFAPSNGLVTLVNHEVCPRWNCRNPFRECTFFKLNGKTGFNLYTNGKTAVRCRPGVWARDAHSFSSFTGRSHTAADVSVLHYACPSYDRWMTKYAALGDFPDFWWDDPAHRIALKFHLESRDTYRSCLNVGAFDQAEAFWAAQVLAEPELRRMVQEGRVGQFDPLASRA